MDQPSPTAIQWHRIPPLAVVFFLFGFLRQVVTQGLPYVAVSLAGIVQSDSLGLGTVIGLGVLLLLVVLLGAVMSWLRFRYRLSEDRVLVRKGVIKREELDIDFDRIQNINIREPFYMRPFGLAVLGIDTAGSAGKEVQLAAIELPVAQQLRQTILSVQQTSATHVEAPDPDAGHTTAEQFTAGSQEALIELTRRDVLVYGLTANFMLWILVAVGALFSTGGDTVDAALGWLVRTVQLDQLVDYLQAHGGPIAMGLAAVAIALLVMLVLPLLSMVGALFRYDGFRLERKDETFRKSSGLLTRFDESIKQHKIQAVVWNQNVIARIFGRFNLQLRQASAGEGIENGELPTGAKTRFLVPSLSPEQARELSREFLPASNPAQAQYSSINRRSFTSLHMRIWLIPLTLIASGLAFVLSAWVLLIVPLFAAVQFAVLTRRWSRWGWAVEGETGYVRKGFIGQVTTLFPVFKVQRVDIRQTPWQKRKGLAHLVVHLASHSLEVPYMDERQAYAFRNYALFAAETDARKWF